VPIVPGLGLNLAVYGNLISLNKGGAKSGARDAATDLGLATAVNAWPTLPAPFTRGILAMILAIGRSESS
jgi:hypothetical protein